MASLAVCVAALAACKTQPPAVTETGPRRFSSPQEAVDEANVLLDARDWRGLARCYDLSLAPGVDIEELRSGRFFVGGKTPFPPESDYLEAMPLGNPSTLPCGWRVTTVRLIDQGGGAKQRVTSDCWVIQRAEGWQFLPAAPAAPSR